MKWILLLAFSFPVFAATANQHTRVIDKVKKFKWNGKHYQLELNTYLKKFSLDADHRWVPCLENAQKSNMSVLLMIDESGPVIKSCKLYSDSLPVTKSIIEGQSKQAQEATGPVKKH